MAGGSPRGRWTAPSASPTSPPILPWRWRHCTVTTAGSWPCANICQQLQLEGAHSVQLRSRRFGVGGGQRKALALAQVLAKSGWRAMCSGPGAQSKSCGAGPSTASVHLTGGCLNHAPRRRRGRTDADGSRTLRTGRTGVLVAAKRRSAVLARTRGQDWNFRGSEGHPACLGTARSSSGPTNSMQHRGSIRSFQDCTA